MTPQQQALLQKAARSVQAAKVLNETGFPEFSASRAYYAMFYVASAFLEGEGMTFSSHAAVIGAFGQQFARTGRVPVEFQRYLIDAQDTRNRSDYNIDPGLTTEQAAVQINLAEQFLELAAQLIGLLPE